MSNFIAESTEKLLIRENRELPLPDGRVRDFGGSRLLWKAFDILIICARWDPEEIVSLALMRQEGENIKGLLPYKHEILGIVTKMEIDMLESPRIDPTMFRYTYGDKREGLSLEESLHEVIGQLYTDFQDRLDAGTQPY